MSEIAVLVNCQSRYFYRPAGETDFWHQKSYPAIYKPMGVLYPKRSDPRRIPTTLVGAEGQLGNQIEGATDIGL